MGTDHKYIYELCVKLFLC